MKLHHYTADFFYDGALPVDEWWADDSPDDCHVHLSVQVPVITDLRNPCMKPEHWRTLEAVVGSSLNVEQLTMAFMEEFNVFSFGTEIQEVSPKFSLLFSLNILSFGVQYYRHRHTVSLFPNHPVSKLYAAFYYWCSNVWYITDAHWRNKRYEF